MHVKANLYFSISWDMSLNSVVMRNEGREYCYANGWPSVT